MSPTTSAEICGRCRKPLALGEGRLVPRPLAWLGIAAFALMHGGLWAYEGLRRPFCLDCRRLVALLLALFAALAAAAFAAGASFLLTLAGQR